MAMAYTMSNLTSWLLVGCWLASGSLSSHTAPEPARRLPVGVSHVPWAAPVPCSSVFPNNCAKRGAHHDSNVPLHRCMHHAPTMPVLPLHQRPNYTAAQLPLVCAT